jgi:alpha-1,2-mannosyltransferase
MTYAATAAWLRKRIWFGAVLGVVPWVVWLGSLAVGGWYKDAEGTLVGADHLAFFHAACLIGEGRQGDLYKYGLLRDEGYQSGLIGWNWGGFLAYRNPPFYALLYLPTTGYSFYTSYLIWTAIGLGLLALSILLLRPQRPLCAFLWALAFYPVFAVVSFGQNTFISLAIFAGVYRLLESDRRFAAGLVAGLLWFKPQLLLGLLVWWAFQPKRYLRTWLGVALAGGVLGAVSWGALPEASQAFVDALGGNVKFTGEKMWNKHTPRAFFEMLLPGLPTGVYWGLGGVISLICVAIAWRINRRSGAPIATMFPVAVFLSLYASPHALIYEWALVFAAGVVLWERYPEDRDAWLCLFAVVWVVLTASTPISLVQEKFMGLPAVVQISVPVMGLVGWLAARQLTTARPPSARV